MSNLNIIIGQTFGKWTIINGPKLIGKYPRKAYLCRCECGVEKYVFQNNLLNKVSKQCVNCYHKERQLKRMTDVGSVYGKWKVLSLFKIDERNYAYNCECKCGNTAQIRRGNIGIHYQPPCKNCDRGQKISKSNLDYVWKKILWCAQSRKLDINIDLPYILFLLDKQKNICALSGMQINLEHMATKKRNNTASLDRIDSSKGYIEGNVQWVHKHINMMKQDYTTREFINYCKLVVNYNK